MRKKLFDTYIILLLNIAPVQALVHEKQNGPLTHIQASQQHMIEDSYDDLFEEALQQEPLQPPSRVVVALQSVGWYFFEWYLSLRQCCSTTAKKTRAGLAKFLVYMKITKNGS